MSGECGKCGEHCLDCRCKKLKYNPLMYDFLENFWDWMHHNWTYASHTYCSSGKDDNSFKEYIEKFLDEQSVAK